MDHYINSKPFRKIESDIFEGHWEDQAHFIPPSPSVMYTDTNTHTHTHIHTLSQIFLLHIHDTPDSTTKTSTSLLQPQPSRSPGFVFSVKDEALVAMAVPAGS